MSCFRCKYDGTRICDPVEAELRCTVCGRCEAERLAGLAVLAAEVAP